MGKTLIPPKMLHKRQCEYSEKSEIKNEISEVWENWENWENNLIGAFRGNNRGVLPISYLTNNLRAIYLMYGFARFFIRYIRRPASGN